MDHSLWKRWVLGSMAVLALSSMGWAFVMARRVTSRSDLVRARRQGRPIPVRTDKVRRLAMDQVIGATATTEPSLSADIMVSASHVYLAHVLSTYTIDKVFTSEGAAVKQGQALFKLQDQVYLQAVRQQEAVLVDAEAQVKLAEQELISNRLIRAANLAMAENEITYRTKDLEYKTKLFEATTRLKTKGWASLFEYYTIRSQLAQARYELRKAEQQIQIVKVSLDVAPLQNQRALTLARANLETARSGIIVSHRDLDRMEIRSPIDGIASRVNIVPGQVVLTSTVLMQVFKLDPIHIRMDLPQERVDDVRIGQPAEIVLDSFPKETFHGTVIRISAQADPSQRVVSVVLRVNNPNNRVRGGVSGFVRLQDPREVLIVPATAVIDDGSQAMVFRVEGDRARIRSIRTGRALENGMIEVRGGLDPGDEVVIFSNFYKNLTKLADNEGFLLDNDAVDVHWRKWSRRD